ncbi:MAG: aminotransferase class I/II-fold pyridoxal phosphate-dependent enzyme [Pseudomonadota bacterium]
MSGDEERLIAEVFASNYIAPVGPMIEAFEADFRTLTSHRAAVALSSGTAAIHLGLRGLGVRPGDEVWFATLTFIGGVSPAIQLGADPVFFDVDPKTWTFDLGLLEAELAKAATAKRLPRAVVPTDVFGQSCDLDGIAELCARYGVGLLVDSAEAMGTLYKGRHAGAGHLAAYSFNGNKIITTSGGGMLCGQDESLIAKARHWSTQARDPAAHYEHSELGYNYRMSNVLAAIGRAQLAALPERVERRRAIFDAYRAGLSDLPGISFMPEADYGRSTRWLTVMLIDAEQFGTDREGIRLALEEGNMEARPVWKPMHQQPVFATARRVGGAVAEGLFDRGLCLPSGTAMTDHDQDRVISAIRGLARS